MTMARRDMLKTAIATTGACAFYNPLDSLAAAQKPIDTAAVKNGADKPKGVQWPIGCFNRVWGRWTYDEALDGIREAGYRVTGLLGNHRGEAFTMHNAGEGYLDALKQRIEKRGLSIVVTWFRTNHVIPLKESIKQARKQIDNAKRLGVKYMLTTGAGDADQYDHYCRVMSDAAAYADKSEMQVVLKPHGGSSASADEILRCVDKVDNSNFRVWYDAGNIIHYTGKNPIADVRRVSHLVTGFCAKDCAKKKGDVMLQFGRGKVNFRSVFAELKNTGFNGPVLVECCAGKTPQEVTTNMRVNREFLKRLFADL